MGPPGLLSLSLVREPILQQPHARFLTPTLPRYVRAYFYGSTTSQTDPERYIHFGLSHIGIQDCHCHRPMIVIR